MKRLRSVLFCVAVALALVLPLAAQDTGVVIQIPGFEVGWVDLAVGFFGFGLVQLINLIKKKFGWEAKKAVVLTFAVSIVAAAGVLLIKSSFNWKLLIIYSLAIVGNLTGWFKFTKKAA